MCHVPRAVFHVEIGTNRPSPRVPRPFSSIKLVLVFSIL